MWSTGEEREEAKAHALEQISAKFKEAGIEQIDSLVKDTIQRITVLGPNGDRHGLMSDQASTGVEQILNNNPKLKEFTVDICEILENLAPTPAAKLALQATFLPVKTANMTKEAKFAAANMLDTVQVTMTNIAENPSVRNTMGDVHADKIGQMVTEMNENLKGVDNLSDRAEIMLKGVQKVDKYVENAGKQAEQNKFGKISNIIKASIKVICTLGMNKSARLELASEKFTMDNTNAEKLKAGSKVLSSGLKTATIVTNQAKKQSSGMER